MKRSFITFKAAFCCYIFHFHNTSEIILRVVEGNAVEWQTQNYNRLQIKFLPLSKTYDVSCIIDSSNRILKLSKSKIFRKRKTFFENVYLS